VAHHKEGLAVDAFEEVIGLIIAMPVIAGGILLTGQIGYFFYAGMWLPYTGIDVLKTVAEFIGPATLADWSSQPDAWSGLHHILSIVPAAGFLLLLTGALFIAFKAFAALVNRG
jgi:hypothetical protein